MVRFENKNVSLALKRHISEMAKFSTRFKVTAGYVLLTLLLVATMGYIYYSIRQMTDSGDFDKQLSARRSMANEVMNELNKAEIIVQTIAIGKTGEYSNYKKVMSRVGKAVDSLKCMTVDSLNSARLDTVSLLLLRKESNMKKLMKVISSNDIEKIYRREIEEMISLQDSLLALNHKSRKVVMHTRSQVMPSKKKNFFKRFGEVFAPPKDSVVVSDTIYEVYTDSLSDAAAISDTITSYLKSVQLRMSDNRRQQVKELDALMQRLRLSSLMLNESVRQLLTTIEDEDRAWAQAQRDESEKMRHAATWTISAIALAAVILAGVFLFFIWRDIARSNHYRKELEKAKQHAEKLLDAKEKLMLTITHDIKAPVGSILGYTELLDNITTGERQQFYLQNLHGSASHLLQLVNSLLDFHRLDADKMECQHVAFNAKELFDGIVESYRPLASGNNLELESNCDGGLDEIFMGDPLRIRQITENLLGNALKFTSEGSVTLNVNIVDEFLHISVSDTGCGISPDDMENLFKEFTRLDNAQGKEGFGLGLAITNKLVRLLGGEIDVKSGLGEGTTFEVTLPLERSSSQPVADAAGDEAPEIPEIRVLIIDDDPLQTNMMAAMLGNHAITAVSCNHPDELFIHLQQQPFDIIITDIQMPAMDGIELIGRIRKIQSAADIPVVAITARGDMNTEKLSAHGFALCIHKPFTGKELLAGIAGVLKDSDLCSVGGTACEEVTAEPELPASGKPDFSQLVAFSMGDDDAVAEIMNTFIDETKKKRDRLAYGKKERDMQAVTAVAHQLLPVFVMTGVNCGKEELEWFEARRDETLYTGDCDARLETVLASLDNIISEAENEFTLNK